MIVDNDDLTHFYTGLPKYSVFKAVAKYNSRKAQHLSPWKTSSGSAECMSEDDNRRGAQPWQKLSVETKLFAVLARLRLGLLVKDVSTRLVMSAATYSRLFSTWIVFLEKELSLLFPWPSHAQVHDWMPECFCQRYPNTRIIIIVWSCRSNGHPPSSTSRRPTPITKAGTHSRS